MPDLKSRRSVDLLAWISSVSMVVPFCPNSPPFSTNWSTSLKLMEPERKSWMGFLGSSKHTYYHIKHERDGYAYDWYSVVEVANADWEKFMSEQQPWIQSFYEEFNWKGIDEPPIYVSAPNFSIWTKKDFDDMITSSQLWEEIQPETDLVEPLKTLLLTQSMRVDFVSLAS